MKMIIIMGWVWLRSLNLSPPDTHPFTVVSLQGFNRASLIDWITDSLEWLICIESRYKLYNILVVKYFNLRIFLEYVPFQFLLLLLIFSIQTRAYIMYIGNYSTGCVSSYDLSCNFSKHGSSRPPFELICISEAGQPFWYALKEVCHS